jgi:hypothetical protein
MQGVHVALRLVLLALLGSLGCSSVYWLAYLALPAIAAIFVSRDGSARYLDRDAPNIRRLLRWAGGVYAYLWLLTDSLPRMDEAGPVELEVMTEGTPTVSSALTRLLSSLPALVLLALLSILAVPLWAIGAVAILATERTPAPIANFMSMMLRYQFRLVAYHLSLVDAYPSLADTTTTDAHSPQAT